MLLCSMHSGLPLLAGGVPDLGLDGLVVDEEGAGLELDADGGLGVDGELVAGEAGEDLGLADGGVPDQHHLEHVVHLLPARHLPLSLLAV
ncbi:Os10g0377450, partial [Oryza sativa Japonica Group]